LYPIKSDRQWLIQGRAEYNSFFSAPLHRPAEIPYDERTHNTGKSLALEHNLEGNKYIDPQNTDAVDSAIARSAGDDNLFKIRFA
jgi:hypothetical protein